MKYIKKKKQTNQKNGNLFPKRKIIEETNRIKHIRKFGAFYRVKPMKAPSAMEFKIIARREKMKKRVQGFQPC